MPSNIIKSFAKRSNKTEKEIEVLWNKAKDIVKKEYVNIEPESQKFYALTTGVLKNMITLNDSKFNKVYENIKKKLSGEEPEDTKELEEGNFDDEAQLKKKAMKGVDEKGKCKDEDEEEITEDEDEDDDSDEDDEKEEVKESDDSDEDDKDAEKVPFEEAILNRINKLKK